MNIQSTGMAVSQNLTFENRRVTTKLPKNLKAKPKYNPPKGFLISLVPLSILGFGTYYWQTHKKEAMQEYWKNVINELFKQIEASTPTDSVDVANADTITFQEAVSIDSTTVPAKD